MVLGSSNVSSLFVLLGVLILVSAFFSGSETGMMAINRYRLRHLARKGDLSAQRVAALLQRPDRLLAVILVGNTFANILASSIATVLAVHYWGDVGVILATVLLTIVVLVFAETTPKTLAALHPQRVSFFAALPLKILLIILYPLIWMVNGLANGFLRLLRVHVASHKSDQLSAEELRTVVAEAGGKISSAHQRMLLRILELERATVDAVMVPRNEIQGIDICQNWETISQVLWASPHQYLPVYRENIDQVIGMLNLQTLIPFFRAEELDVNRLLEQLDEIYYIPEVTLMNRQLLNFQQENRTVGLVVDEYGDIQGLLTLQDILEEMVGQFAVDEADIARLVEKQKDNSYLIDGAISVRDLNRIASWSLPVDGPRTLSGLIVERLEMIPTNNVCLQIHHYRMEVLEVSDNKIRLVRVLPQEIRHEK